MANHKRFVEPEEIKKLDEVIQEVIQGTLSFRKGAQRMREAFDKPFTHEALRKIVKKKIVDDRTDRESRLGD
jgi:2-hydroxy-3-keto-5-methylthiopentenyl-1-phosphate phosphatase